MLKHAGLVAALSATLVSPWASPSARADSFTASEQRIDAQVNANYPALLALYKDLHQHPELGFQETRTAARLAQEMRSAGFKVTEHVGGTGLVALFENGAGPIPS